MPQGMVVTVFRDAIITAFLMAAPFLLVSLLIGLAISVFQAATQIHEQNIIFVPKIVATGLLLIMLGSWLISVMTGFTLRLFSDIASYL